MVALIVAVLAFMAGLGLGLRWGAEWGEARAFGSAAAAIDRVVGRVDQSAGGVPMFRRELDEVAKRWHRGLP